MFQRSLLLRTVRVGKHLLLFICILFALNNRTYISAQTIGTINFQGKVVRDSGLNVSSSETTCIQSGTDTCGFQMAYYTATSGGTLLGTETFTNVEIGDYGGVVNLALGTGSFSAGSESSFANVFVNNDTVFAELRFDHDGNASYTEVFGRLAVRGAAYAMRSSESDSLGGRSSSGYVQLSPSGVQTDSSTSSSIFINKTGSSGNILQLQKNASDVLVLSNGGDLGVGISSPSARLHIVKSGAEQLRIGSDASNYYSTTVSSTGAVTFSATGTGASFNFANALLPTVNNSIALGSTNYRWSDLYLGGSSLHIGADGNEGIISYNTTNKYITIGTSNASNALTITDEGRVGIGTSEPLATLHISLPLGTPTFSDGFEDGTLDPFTTSGNQDWFVQDSTVYEGTYAAQAGPITHVQATKMELTQTLATASEISFYVKVSTEHITMDLLSFQINGIVQHYWGGEQDWQKFTTYVPAGTHTFAWIYHKDIDSSGGSDTAWIDNVVITPQPTQSLFAGSIGIGLTNPQYPLDINGNINTNSSYTINGKNALALGGTSISLGMDAGNPAIGGANVFLGGNAGKNNTGNLNIFVGWRSGQNNIGNFNTFVGNHAGKTNTTGNQNTLVGSYSGTENTTGRLNDAFGTYSLYFNTTGIRNTVLCNTSKCQFSVTYLKGSSNIVKCN